MHLIIELTAYESLYSVKPSNKKVSFETDTKSEKEEKENPKKIEN